MVIEVESRVLGLLIVNISKTGYFHDKTKIFIGKSSNEWFDAKHVAESLSMTSPGLLGARGKKVFLQKKFFFQKKIFFHKNQFFFQKKVFSKQHFFLQQNVFLLKKIFFLSNDSLFSIKNFFEKKLFPTKKCYFD